MPKRRYEVNLPLKYNDGRPVEAEKLYRTREELITQFGALSIVPSSVLGVWVHEGSRYEDELLRLVIDVDVSAATQEFFVDYKQILLERFEQIEIYIASYAVEII